jgi:hypothetical protein
MNSQVVGGAGLCPAGAEARAEGAAQGGGSRGKPGFPRALPRAQFFRAAARPPLRPAAFFCAVVPPCDELLRRVPEPDCFPPRLEAPGELAIRAARSFDIPFFFS